ncbi:hypothetical protein LSH36_420g00000 [Paralvinella palmiformis]|uniref:CIP2A N-terminal domain-containing protein n=1 Tax=Paralvinella palmiformis TaxID=53620 RepID=A0AAD9JBZ3_9ANNE|nr:hypothetical protein LSH36_420g00000 [Paralvinella palmiformis]
MELMTSVQAVVNASMVYLSNRSDVNQVQLQRQLDVLISLTGRVSSLGCFNPKEMLPAECLSYLVDIMDDPQTKSTLAQKVLLLFHNLANKRDLSSILHSTFNLTSCLARFLKTQTISAADPNVLLSVKLLQKITYNCKVSFQEVYVEDLIKLIIIQIQEKEDELTLPCVSLLANLCRHNLPVQMIIKNQPYQLSSVCASMSLWERR